MGMNCRHCMTGAELKTLRESTPPPASRDPNRSGPKPEHMSQAELAELLHTTVRTISRWERGERSISSTNAELIRMKLG